MLDIAEMMPKEAIDKILKNRGIKNVVCFLEPTEEDLLPFDALPNLEEASEIVINGILNNKKFVVLYDVDTDGIMAGTIMTRYLQDMNVDVTYYINKGKIHGTTKNFIEFCKNVDIVIIVDSLDSKTDNYKTLFEMGKDILILDHHHVGDEPYDDYVTLVTSYGSENDQLSGGGVVYKFINYIDEELGTTYAEKYADLCCCALLGDMMDVGEEYPENRFLIKDGLDHLKNKTLKKMVGGFGFDSRSVQFSVSPKINACQRLAKNNWAVEAFLTNDDDEIKRYIKLFDGLRTEQNAIVNKEIKKNQSKIRKQLNDKTLFVLIDNVDAGVSGFIANKLMANYQKPVFVLSKSRDKYSGSCRSINTEDMRLICEKSGLGMFLGHPNSFGVVNVEHPEILKEYLESYLQTYKYSVYEEFDAEIDAADLTDDLIKEVKKVDRISGNGFDSLKFKVTISDFVIGEMSNGKHLYLSPRDRDDVRIIVWNVSDAIKNKVYDAELFEDELYCIGALQSGWFGRKYYLQVITDNFKINN